MQRNVYDQSKLIINAHLNVELYNVVLTHTYTHTPPHTHKHSQSYRVALQGVCTMATHTGGL